MKKLILLLFSVAGISFGQNCTGTGCIPFPSIGLPPANHATSGVIGVRDRTDAHTVGFKIGLAVPATDLVWQLPTADSAGPLCSSGALSWTIGGCGGVPPFTDNLPLISNVIDTTKLVRFSAASVSAGTTRVVTVPNFNFIMAAKDVDNVFSVDQSFAGNIFASGTTRVIGSGGNPFQIIRAEAQAFVYRPTGATWTWTAGVDGGGFNRADLNDPGGTTRIRCTGNGSPSCIFGWQVSAPTFLATTSVTAGTKVEGDAVGAAIAFTNGPGTFRADGNGNAWAQALVLNGGTASINGTLATFPFVFADELDVITNIVVNGSTGVTGTTCTQWKMGICIHL